MVEIVPRSLHFVAGAPRTARKKTPAAPVGMTNSENAKQERREHRDKEEHSQEWLSYKGGELDQVVLGGEGADGIRGNLD